VLPELGATLVVHEVLGGVLGGNQLLGAKGVAEVKGPVGQLVGDNEQVGAVVDKAGLPLQGHKPGHIARFALHVINEEEVEGIALEVVNLLKLAYYRLLNEAGKLFQRTLS